MTIVGNIIDSNAAPSDVTLVLQALTLYGGQAICADADKVAARVSDLAARIRSGALRLADAESIRASWGPGRERAEKAEAALRACRDALAGVAADYRAIGMTQTGVPAYEAAIAAADAALEGKP